MKKITVLHNQTLLDVCLQHTGSAETLLDLMRMNSLTSFDVLPGTELIIPKIQNKRVVDYFATDNQKQIIPAGKHSNDYLAKLTINGNPWITLSSMDNKNIDFKNQFGEPIEPISITESEIVVDVTTETFFDLIINVNGNQVAELNIDSSENNTINLTL
jgi:hypothetical protein